MCLYVTTFTVTWIIDKISISLVSVKMTYIICRAVSRFAPSQRETVLLWNDVSHWLGASLESALIWSNNCRTGLSIDGYYYHNKKKFNKYIGSSVSNDTRTITSWKGNIFRVTGHLCGEFPGEFPAQRPVTRSFDVFFDLRQNKRLSKQSWGWWFETPSHPFWRHHNAGVRYEFQQTIQRCTQLHSLHCLYNSHVPTHTIAHTGIYSIGLMEACNYITVTS